MKIIKRLNDLAPMALAGLLLVAGAQGAMAASAAVQAPRVSNPVITQADYMYHKKHYAYHYNGHYYNHRSQKNGVWHYS